MKIWKRLLLSFTAGAFSAAIGQVPSNCTDTRITSDSGTPYTYRVCLPDPAKANGGLVVFAHGYVAPNNDLPVRIPEDQLTLGGISVSDTVTGLGFVFAATSYPKTGLAIVEGVEDVKRLVDFVKLSYPVQRVFLAGVSEGGLVTAKAIEKYGATTFSGGLALCGPVGDFDKQIDHIGDFRVVFDYFFPGVLPPAAVNVPAVLQQNWETTYVPAIAAAATANPGSLKQLLSVTKVPADPANTADAVLGLLWYNVFATNEARVELNGGPYTGNQGQPFDNRFRWYWGSSNDLRLNLLVKRYAADPSATAQLRQSYITSGRLPVPLVTMHTTGDPIVPYSQELIYGAKVLASGSLGHYVHLPVYRYGHCAFTQQEVLFGFSLLVAMAQ